MSRRPIDPHQRIRFLLLGAFLIALFVYAYISRDTFSNMFDAVAPRGFH